MKFEANPAKYNTNSFTMICEPKNVKRVGNTLFITVFNGVYLTVKAFGNAFNLDELEMFLIDCIANGNRVNISFSFRWEYVPEQRLTQHELEIKRNGGKITRTFQRLEGICIHKEDTDE